MALENCIKQVCDKAADTTKALNNTENQAVALLNAMAADSKALQCIMTGPVGTYCQSGGVTHLTVAEALARLNAMPAIGSISEEVFTATAGQTTVTLGAAVPNPAALEVELNGALLQTPRDWNVAGTTVTFTQPLDVGDQVDTRLFTV